MTAVCACCVALPSPVSIPGEMRVQLLNQTLLDLGFYDDGPYEVADQKQLNAQLIPVPSHSYLGRISPPCSLMPLHRREREGRWRVTSGLRLDSNMAARTTGARTGSSCQNASNCSFPVDYFWMSLSVCDSQSLECYSAFFFKRVPTWIWVDMLKMSRAFCGLAWILMMPEFAKVGLYKGNIYPQKLNPTTMTVFSFHLPPSSKSKVQKNMSQLYRGWCATSWRAVWAWNVVPPPGTRWFCWTAVAPQRQNTNQSQPDSPAPPSPLFFLSFHLHPPSPFHHPITPSYTRTLSLFLSPLFPCLGP